MSTDATPADLSIPDAAADGWFQCGCTESGCTRAGYQAEALPLIVAAELRRLADFYSAVVVYCGTSRGVQTGNKAFSLVARQLRARADELDGGAR